MSSGWILGTGEVHETRNEEQAEKFSENPSAVQINLVL